MSKVKGRLSIVMGKTFGISEIFTIIKKQWIWILIISMAFAGVAFAYFNFFVEKTYTSSVVIYVCRKGEITYSDQLLSKEVSSSAVVLLSTSNDYISEDNPHFSQVMEEGYTKDIIKSMLNFSVVNDTGVVRISITSNDKNITKKVGDALYDTVPDYLEEIIYGTQVKPVAEAKEGIHSGPAIYRNTAIAFLIAVVLSFGIFALAFILDNTIKDDEAFRNSFDIPFLGEIPRIATNGKKTSHSLSGASSFRFVETFKSIRTALFYVLPTMKNNVFAISSPGEKEGKSTITFNLSASMAEANVKVLVIDADMRKPTIAKYFCLENKNGLSKILSKQSKFEDAVNKDVIPNLDILTSGPIPPNPSELLSSEAVDELLEYVKDKYDYVLIDTAPINIVTDSLLLLDKIAGIVVVARYGTTPYTEMQKAVDNIASVNGTVLGSVINDVVLSSKAYSYKKGYKYTYKYSYTYGGHSDRKVATTFENIGNSRQNEEESEKSSSKKEKK